MRARGVPRRVEWARYRTLGFDLLLVGILVLIVSAGFAVSTVCPYPSVCSFAVDWPTLSPALALIAAGSVISALARWRREGMA